MTNPITNLLKRIVELCYHEAEGIRRGLHSTADRLHHVLDRYRAADEQIRQRIQQTSSHRETHDPPSVRPDPNPNTLAILRRHGDVLHEGNLTETGTPLYRGVPRLLSDGTENPAYRQAASGVAEARGTSDVSAQDHITQVCANDSDSTSWTRSHTVAAKFTHGDGVILEWRTGYPPPGASWNFKPTLDIEDDLSQVLIQGTLTDARATRFLNNEMETGAAEPSS